MLEILNAFLQIQQSPIFIFFSASHVSRRHKDGANEHLVDSVVNPGMSHECEQEQSDMQNDPPSDADYEPSDVFVETADESLFLKNVALFYLKLQV